MRFHDLRHTFATTALDIYTHIADTMQQEAAASIDRGIGKAKPLTGDSEQGREMVLKPAVSDFQPYKRKTRKPGTGCITQINDHLWEGRYSPMWPNGKKLSHNVYAHTREECEALLPWLIEEIKTEIAELKLAQKVKQTAV